MHESVYFTEGTLVFDLKHNIFFSQKHDTSPCASDSFFPFCCCLILVHVLSYDKEHGLAILNTDSSLKP